MTVLAIGIGLLAAVSWAANGLLAARSAAQPVSNAAATESASSAPAHARTSTRPSSRPSSSPAPSPHHSSVAPAAARPARACVPGAVTLLLSTPQNFWQPGATPRFMVSAISGRARPCRFNMGTGFVAVVVTDGSRRIWSSADCVSGGGSNRVVLTKGVPAVLHLSWDMRTSSPGCSGVRRLVSAGEYQVAAVAGPIRSATQNFVLGAKGVSGP